MFDIWNSIAILIALIDVIGIVVKVGKLEYEISNKKKDDKKDDEKENTYPVKKSHLWQFISNGSFSEIDAFWSMIFSYLHLNL